MLKKLLVFGALLTTILLPVAGHAAQFVSPDKDNQNLLIEDKNKNYENLYISGSTIEIRTPIKKDLVAAGSSVTVKSDIERSLIAASGSLIVEDAKIGASVRIAAGNISLNDVTIEEDLIVTGGNVSLNNVKIKGDMIVSSGTLVMENSRVEKNFYGSSSDIDREKLKSQVGGDIQVAEQKENKNNDYVAENYIKIMMEVSALVVLSAVVIILSRTKKLKDESISFQNLYFLKHLGIGIGSYLLIPLVIVVSLIPVFLLLPLALTVSGLIIFASLLLSPLTSWYIANLASNVFKFQIHWWTVFAFYFGIWILSLIPIIGVIVGILVTIFGLANFGYWVYYLSRLKVKYLQSDAKSIEEF